MMIFHDDFFDKKDHFNMFESHKHGPIQKDEAYFLYGLVKMIRPSTIVEFGLQTGVSSYNFCISKDKESYYFGLDCDYFCVEKTKSICKNFANAFFIKDDCRNFNHSIIQNRTIDLFFLDCSHDFEANKFCLKKAVEYLEERGIIVIHDTGYYTIEGFKKAPETYKKYHKNLGDQIKKFGKIAVIKSEQKTVNWFIDKHKEFSVIHFHCDHVMRNGMTFFQKKFKLN